MRLPTTESVIYEKSARSDDADIGYKRSVLILFFVRRSKQAAPLLSLSLELVVQDIAISVGSITKV